MRIKGKQSIVFANAPIITETSSVVGEKEGNGPLGEYFDLIEMDSMFGEKCWEAAESKLQQLAVEVALKKYNHNDRLPRYFIGGDLLGQLIATSYGIEDFSVPVIGVYGACSTIGEALLIGALFVDGGYADCVMAITSSHFASAEKEFRFPLGYGSQRPPAAAWTVTGSGTMIICSEGKVSKDAEAETVTGGDDCTDEGSIGSTDRRKIRITSATPGKILDYGVKDSLNMGACMAPAAADTIAVHLQDMEREAGYYDKIITGDLGIYGSDMLIELLKERGYDISKQHIDCGVLIYDADTQDTHAGGSGCGCSAVTFAGYIMSKLKTGEWKRILFVPTGALLSTISFNEGNTIPSIAHAVAIESIE